MLKSPVLLSLISIAAFTGCLFLSSANALAQDATDEQLTIEKKQNNSKKGKSDKKGKTVDERSELKYVVESDVEYEREQVKERPKYERTQKDYGYIHDRAGVELSASVGLVATAMVGFGGNLYLGYSINRYFAFGAEFSGNMSYTPGFVVALVPKLQIPKDKFRFSFGLGLGYGRIYPSWSSDPKKLHSFALKPELIFDWYYDENLFVGFGVDWVGYFAIKSLNDIENYHQNVNAFLTFYLYFHIGYRF